MYYTVSKGHPRPLMRYGNGEHNVPWSPYDLKLQNINEEFHVYKANDNKYKANIADVLKAGINIIKEEPQKLKKLYLESDIKYAKIIKNGQDFDLKTDIIVFYIGINPRFNFNESDDSNITVPINDDEFVDSVKPLYIGDDKITKQVSIIITGSENIL